MTAWYDKAIFYHMYPLGMTGAPFANPYPVSDETADGTWDVSADSRMDELMQWIPYLESLHISALYIGPLFESSTHGYDTRDFRLIDRRLGTNVSFRSFVDCCHEHGIRVVVDGVFNHTGREFFAFRDLQAHRDQSPYAGWYRNVNFGWGSPLGDSFVSISGAVITHMDDGTGRMVQVVVENEILVPSAFSVCGTQECGYIQVKCVSASFLCIPSQTYGYFL